MRNELLINLLPLDGNATYLKNFLNSSKDQKLFEHLMKSKLWKQYDVKVFGKVYPQPRLTIFMGNEGLTYKYSNLLLNTVKWDKNVFELKEEIESFARLEFNCVLLNLYRNGEDSNGYHSDDEKEMGKNPSVASYSLGEQRMFHLKHKYKKCDVIKLNLENNSLLIMKSETQHFWQHQIAKTKKKVGPRINLTFRKIINES